MSATLPLVAFVQASTVEERVMVGGVAKLEWFAWLLGWSKAEYFQEKVVGCERAKQEEMR